MMTVETRSNPYPGLRPFQKVEWNLFFGREPIIDAVLDRLAESNMVVVHGASGCGKSSLIRAGVLPRLEHEYSRYETKWRTVDMRPESSPLWNLATAIARLVESSESDSEPAFDKIRTIRRLLNIGVGAFSRIQEVFDLGRSHNVCLLIDQFEEVFRYARQINREEVETFVQVLRGFEQSTAGAARTPLAGIHVILTMRSDYLGDCCKFHGFAELVNATQYLLPAIRDEDLLRAIREPARRFGGEVSVDLSLRLIDEGCIHGDALPLIQHSLMRLWQQAADSERVGTKCSETGHPVPFPILQAESFTRLDRMLSDHAEEILQEATLAHVKAGKVAEYVFRSIIEIDLSGRGIRRPMSLSELVEVAGTDKRTVSEVVEKFARPSFLVISSGDEPVVDIGHEALIRCWTRLDDPTIDLTTKRPRGWVQKEQEDGQIWRALLVQAMSLTRRARIVPLTQTWKRQIRAIFEPRLDWFDALPKGDSWSARYGGGSVVLTRLIKLARTLKNRRRVTLFVSVAWIGLMYGSLALGEFLEPSLQSLWLKGRLFLGYIFYPLAVWYLVSRVRVTWLYNQCFDEAERSEAFGGKAVGPWNSSAK